MLMKRHLSPLSHANRHGYRSGRATVNSNRSHERSRDIDTEWANGHGLPLALVAVVVMVMTLMMPDDLPLGMETAGSMQPVGPSAIRVDTDPISPISSALVDQI